MTVQQIPSLAKDRPVQGRRAFLRWSGVAAAAAVAFGVDVPGLKLGEAFAQSRAVDLGGGDLGVLNYAYALEQLEAAFYTQVIASPYAGMTAYERALLTDIRNHEISHRAFFKKALGANRIPDLAVNFSAVNFGDRMSVLKTAMTFEDLGVSAYNGGGAAIRTPAYLAAAGSIVSVEARHAATVRDMLRPFTEYFAGDDVISRGGVDVSNPPSAVLRAAGPFIATPVTASQLP
jgi:hypothetical protein